MAPGLLDPLVDEWFVNETTSGETGRLAPFRYQLQLQRTSPPVPNLAAGRKPSGLWGAQRDTGRLAPFRYQLQPQRTSPPVPHLAAGREPSGLWGAQIRWFVNRRSILRRFRTHSKSAAAFAAADCISNCCLRVLARRLGLLRQFFAFGGDDRQQFSLWLDELVDAFIHQELVHRFDVQCGINFILDRL